jgi:hypothetical protein
VNIQLHIHVVCLDILRQFMTKSVTINVPIGISHEHNLEICLNTSRLYMRKSGTRNVHIVNIVLHTLETLIHLHKYYAST